MKNIFIFQSKKGTPEHVRTEGISHLGCSLLMKFFRLGLLFSYGQ